MVHEENEVISLDQINGEISVLEEEKPTHLSMQKLASLYIVRDHLIMGLQPSTPVTATIETIPAMETRSEFLESIAGKNVKDVLVVVDELVGTIQLLDSNLYNSFMRKLP